MKAQKESGITKSGVMKRVTIKKASGIVRGTRVRKDIMARDMAKMAKQAGAIDNRITRSVTHVRRGEQYARDVATGKIDACKWVRLACQRHLDDLKASAGRKFKYRFDAEKGERVCRFIEQLPHIKGKWANTPIKLEPWQSFVLTVVFGWVRKSDGLRRFREMYLEVPRKNAKSTIAAGIGLYMFAADGESGAEVYCGATTEKQAWEVFKPARLMAKKAEDFAEAFGIEVNASNLAIQDMAAKFEPIVGDPGDGASPSCSITDEFHEHRTPVQYDSMITGMGAREQPLEVITTTSGSNLAGPCYDKRSQICKILEGVFRNDEIFGIIYTIDDDDDWTDFRNWKKANPNYGVSVFEDYLRARHREAMQRASRQNIIRCKHLDQWMNADVAYFDMLAWHKCGDPKLKIEQFTGKQCWMALDLSSKLDITELVRLFRWQNEKGEDEYAAFCTHYLPEDAAEGDDKSHYAGWAKDGWLTLTPGNVVDYNYIKDDMRDAKERFEIVEVPYDPFQATQLSGDMLAEGFPMVEYGALVKNFSEPMKEFDALVRSGRFHHDGDPVLTWMMSNVIAHVDKKENVFPNKERYESKIDGPVAIIMGIGRAMRQEEPIIIRQAYVEI